MTRCVTNAVWANGSETLRSDSGSPRMESTSSQIQPSRPRSRRFSDFENKARAVGESRDVEQSGLPHEARHTLAAGIHHTSVEKGTTVDPVIRPVGRVTYSGERRRREAGNAAPAESR